MPGIAVLNSPTKYVENNFKNILTSPSNIRRMIFFDKNGADTILKDRSSNAKDATLSLAASSLNPANAGHARYLNFNASGDYWYFPDDAGLSFGDSANDTAFSIVTLLNPNALGCEIFSKMSLGNLEYMFEFAGVGGVNLYFYLFDNSTGGNIYQGTTTSYASDIGSWNTYIVTYSGNKLKTGIKIYRNATKVNDDPGNSGVYTAMEDKEADAGPFLGGKTYVGNHKCAFMALVAEELSQTQITSINTLLRNYVGAS